MDWLTSTPFLTSRRQGLYRGSRKHVLDWTSQASFLTEFEQSLAPCPVRFPDETAFMPQGIDSPAEARLERFGPFWLPRNPAWATLKDWWLCHKAGANTPNWDIAVGCEIEDRPGLVLVEAKANWRELDTTGKRKRANATANSCENHKRIGTAIEEARAGWWLLDKRVSITRDSHYQLANRLAFTWKLASLGIPIVLVYLGFTGDEGIRDAGNEFANDADWQTAFGEYAKHTVPLNLFDRRLIVGATPMWLISRSRPVIEVSPPPPIPSYQAHPVDDQER